MPRRKYSLYFTRYVFPLILVGILGCQSPFSTRKPEIPTTQDSGWEPARSASDVILNLQNSISNRNIEHYTHCFVDPSYSDRNFTFIPDQDAQSHFPEVFIEWTLEQEKNVMDLMFSLIPGDSISYLRFPSTIKEDFGPDSVVTVKQYELQLPHSETTFNTFYTGQLEFRMREDQRGEWNIYYWIDYRLSESDVTWSVLKTSLEG